MIDKAFTKKQKEIIEKDLKRLEQEIKEWKKYSDLGTSNEDNALEFEGIEEKQALTRNAQKDIKELKGALERIKEGKYGICQKCSSPIEKGRLKIYPAAVYCATHARQH